jgi:MtN3 and saliva related transmembrane protein
MFGFQHQNYRRIVVLFMAKDLQGLSMNLTQIIGLAAGVLTACSLLPQVIKTLKEKKAEDVSLVMLFVLQAGLILWIIYGIKREDMPIMATNSFSLLVNIVMVILRIKYRK